MSSSSPEIVIIGAGPNGLAAAVLLAQAGLSVRVIEARDDVGGATRSKELTLPGFVHDVCSSVHPMGALSPFLQALPLAAHGLAWLYPPYSAAHPLDDGPAALLARSFECTGDSLDRGDGRRWKRWFAPFAERAPELFADLLAPLGIPRSPLLFMRFGLSAFRSARSLAHGRFRGARARALFAGCAAHSILPLDFWFSGAVGMVFAISGHAVDWPVARGGSHAITLALASYARSLGVEIVTGQEVGSIEALPSARAYVFDTAPKQLATIAAPWLPRRYLARLHRYVYGPGVFKVDFALSAPIPWRDPEIGKASTVHVGGSFDEIHASERDAWRGVHSDRPFVMLSQQSHFDASRAPAGKHTGHAYCHVPNGSTVDMTAKIEQQIERFAPGFRDTILARRTMTTRDFEAYNPSCIGGAVTGGAAHLTQLFTRPVARLDPYSTPHPRVFLCSASTPPGGGVHGMGGYWAARSVLRRLRIALPQKR